MEANKEQLITNIIANCDYIKELLNENILHAAPISTLIEIAVPLVETRNRFVEILSLDNEEEEDWDFNISIGVCWKPSIPEKYSSILGWVKIQTPIQDNYFLVDFQSR